ncbi:MAG: LysE family translocator [Sphingobacteriia bacterium]|nr:LysE family translocator [Sphingobacteriia bacterium]NCC38633.1 LysE family translocator [Gammaproteobacteria bacterium]
MLELLTTALILGLSAGLAPGPLLTLVIAETLSHDARAGIKVALAPLLTDLPLILVTLLVLSKLAEAQEVLGLISLVGGGLLLYLGFENLRSSGLPNTPDGRPPASLTKGVLANLLNPHPYLFWFSVGGPLLAKAMRLGVVAPTLFLALFYALLVGSKILLAILVGRSKRFVKGRGLVYVLRVIGLLLWVLAFGLIQEGLRLLGLLPSAA